MNTVARSIHKNTSASSLHLKQGQIQGYEREIQSYRSKIVDHQMKVASRSAELGKKSKNQERLHKRNRKKWQGEQWSFQRKLQENIAIQNSQLETLIGMNYSAQHNSGDCEEVTTNKQSDSLISPAPEAKDDRVRDLAEARRKSGFEVWYDELELKIGDGLQKKIDSVYQMQIME